MSVVRRVRVVVAAAVVSCGLGVLLSGCGGIWDSTPGDPVGTWVSGAGDAALELKADGTGRFTVCGDGDPYDYQSATGLTSIPITWHSPREEGWTTGPDIEIFQDQDFKDTTGSGFSTSGILLYWSSGSLQLNLEDDVEVFSRLGDGRFSCSDL